MEKMKFHVTKSVINIREEKIAPLLPFWKQDDKEKFEEDKREIKPMLPLREQEDNN